MTVQNGRNLELENRRLRRLIALAAWGVGSWLLGGVVYLAWTTPISATTVGEGTLSFSNAIALLFVAPIVYGVLFGAAYYADWPLSVPRLAALALAVPAVLALVGLALHNRHVRYDRGLAAFNAYTVHFPRGALGDPYIQDDRSSVVTVCARQVRTGDTNFCVETITEPHFRHRGDYVIDGSFRFRDRDQNPDNTTPVILSPFDCSGSPVACGG